MMTRKAVHSIYLVHIQFIQNVLQYALSFYRLLNFLEIPNNTSDILVHQHQHRQIKFVPMLFYFLDLVELHMYYE